MTLRSLVEPAALQGLVGVSGFAFCATPGCEVAYFAADGQTVHKASLTVRVGVKETESPRPLCYCFGYSVEDIELDLRRDGATRIPDAITAKCRRGEDRCSETNPRGACCLGDVRRVVRAAGFDGGGPSCCSGDT